MRNLAAHRVIKAKKQCVNTCTSVLSAAQLTSCEQLQRPAGVTITCNAAWCAAGVLLCACTDAARKQLSKDFAAATNMGAVAVTGQQSAGQALDTTGSSTEQRPLGKQYRALVTGLLQHNQVGQEAGADSVQACWQVLVKLSSTADWLVESSTHQLSAYALMIPLATACRLM